MSGGSLPCARRSGSSLSSTYTYQNFTNKLKEPFDQTSNSVFADWMTPQRKIQVAYVALVNQRRNHGLHFF